MEAAALGAAELPGVALAGLGSVKLPPPPPRYSSGLNLGGAASAAAASAAAAAAAAGAGAGAGAGGAGGASSSSSSSELGPMHHLLMAVNQASQSDKAPAAYEEAVVHSIFNCPDGPASMLFDTAEVPSGENRSFVAFAGEIATRYSDANRRKFYTLIFTRLAVTAPIKELQKPQAVKDLVDYILKTPSTRPDSTAFLKWTTQTSTFSSWVSQ